MTFGVNIPHHEQPAAVPAPPPETFREFHLRRSGYDVAEPLSAYGAEMADQLRELAFSMAVWAEETRRIALGSL
jgi:hypothetical protein